MNGPAPRYDFPLFVPADRPERLAKALAAAHDAIIIDLEDAVAGENKISARETLARQADVLRTADVSVFVRINASSTSFYSEDLAVCASLPLAGIVLPKAEYGEQLDAARVSQPPGRHIVALVETVRGVENLRETAGKADRIAFGSIDYCADLGCAHDRLALLGARQTIVKESRLANLPAPLDGVTTATRDEALVKQDAEHAAMLGFGGKLLIHPSQIAPSRQGFAPSEAELQWAKNVLETDKGGASALNGEMIDAPVLARARALINKAL